MQGVEMSEWKKVLTVVLLAAVFGLGSILIQHHDTSFWGLVLISVCIAVIIYVIPKQQEKKHLCYKLKIRIAPKWEEIVPYVPKGVKYPEKFWDKIMNDQELEIDREYSLIGKSFSFTIFVDELSGMRQIYSNDTKCFEDKVEVSGHIFAVNNQEKLIEKYGIPKNVSETELEITPEGVGRLTRDKILPYYSEVEKGDNLSIVPFYEIVSHLKKLFFVWGSPMSGVLKFPDELQKSLDKFKIKYETRNYREVLGEWYGSPISEKAQKHTKKAGFILSNDPMLWHTFSTKHFEVSLNIERLKPEDINNGIL
jgi:hypothetical protein